MSSNSIYRQYDIRGIYGSELNENEAFLIGFYFVRQHRLNAIKIGHDARLSQKQLTNALIMGMIGATEGRIDLHYLGCVSTPQFYHSFFSDKDGNNSGIMVTASHNPKEYNGFKFILNGESFDSRNGLYDLKKLVKDNREEVSLLGVLNFPIQDPQHGTNYVNELSNFYDKTLTKEDEQLIQQKNMKIRMDFSQGPASIANKKLYSSKLIGKNIEFIGDKLDGNFSNHGPDPALAGPFLKNISHSSCKNYGKISFTAVFDGDGDRVLFYDEKNALIPMDFVLCKYVEFFAKKNNSISVACDVTVSRAMDDVCKKYNTNLSRLKVGRAYYTDHMKKHNCVFGGERSGHLLFRDFNYFDNPDMAAIVMLKIICDDKKCDAFSELFAEYKNKYFIRSASIALDEGISSDQIMSSLAKQYSDSIVNYVDGISVDMESFWFNIRPSNTEPLIKIVLESHDPKTTEKKLQNILENLLAMCQQK